MTIGGHQCGGGENRHRRHRCHSNHEPERTHTEGPHRGEHGFLLSELHVWKCTEEWACPTMHTRTSATRADAGR
jgi:hypothetical protein